MNTQNLRTLFPTVTKQKILNLSYGEGEHYTVLPMIAQKEDTFYLWGISAMLNLGIIGIHKLKSLFWHKCLADQSAKFDPHRDILQVWLRAA